MARQEQMTVATTQSFGAPDVIVYDDLPLRAPGPWRGARGIDAAGVNFFDTQLRRGLIATATVLLSLGAEGAGTVLEVGDGADPALVDRPVAWVQQPGTYATHAYVRTDRLVPLPEGRE